MKKRNLWAGVAIQCLDETDDVKNNLPITGVITLIITLSNATWLSDSKCPNPS